MTRNYKDYKICVTEIEHPHYGRGYHAEFFIPKDNGVKANIGIYEAFGVKQKPKDVLEFCQKIIDLQ